MADNVIIWADIPVVDLERARKFYAHVTGLPVLSFPGMDDVAVIGDPTAGAPMYSIDLYVGGTPTAEGSTVYLNPYGDIDAAVARVREAGGEVLQDKQWMGDMVGWIAYFKDTEGNRLGFQQSGPAPA